MSKVVVFFADGFEECEGLIVVDLLRRAGIEVTTASIMGTKKITSSHKIKLEADALIDEVDYAAVDAVVLPGGVQGTANLNSDARVLALCKEFAAKKMVAAICAAPSVLAGLGLLEGKKATVNPGFESKMCGAELTHTGVCVTGNIITGRAVGAAMPFALAIVAYLLGDEAAAKLKEQICLE